MSKPSSRPKNNPTQDAAPVGRLDESLADATTKTIQGVQKYRIAILGLLGALIVLVFLVKAIEGISSSSAQATAGQIYEALEAPDVADREPLEHLTRVESLAQEIRGSGGERRAIKLAVSQLLELAETGIYADPTLDPANPDASTAPKADVSPRLLAGARKLATEAGQRHAGDAEFQQWVQGIQKKVDSLDSIRNRLQAARKARDEAAKAEAEAAAAAEAEASAGETASDDAGSTDDSPSPAPDSTGESAPGTPEPAPEKSDP